MSSKAVGFTLPRGQAFRLAIVLVVLALAVRIVPAALIYGSDDVSSWLHVAEAVVNDRNPYETGTLNWPPFWPAMILYSARMAGIYHLPLVLSIKLTPILADASIALALYLWFLKRGKSATAAFKLGLWAALNPVLIFTVSFHGQFDSFPTLFAMLAIMAATEHQERNAPRVSWPAAIWLGLGILAKTWPILLLPACLRVHKTMSQRALFTAAALAPAVLSVGWLYSRSPALIAKYVLNYRSSPGWYGLTTLLHFAPADRREILAPFFQYLFYAAVVLVVAAAWKRAAPRELACLLLLTFYVFTPGFGLQYLFWIVPIGLLAEDSSTRFYSVLAGLTIGLQYLFRPWDGGAVGQFLLWAFDRTPRFAAAYGQERDMVLTCIVEVPLWGFLCWWWWHALSKARRRNVPADTVPTVPAS